MKRTFLILIVSIVLLSVLNAENFIVEDYRVSIDVDAARDMRIREDIVLDYTVPSHGFYRDIQYRFDDGTVADVSVAGASEPFKEERGNSMISLRFGDASALITGLHQYSLLYDFVLGADKYDDYDELYYNIVSPGSWDTPMKHVSFSVTFPYPVDRSRVWVTAGPYGSNYALPFTLSADGRSVSGEYSDLVSGYGITLRAEMDEGFFPEAVRPFDYALLGVCLSAAISILMVLVTATIWYLRGRDSHLIVPPRFSPPSGLSPMDTGYVHDGYLSDRDISAMLIWWADRGFLTIDDGGGDDFTFTKISELPDGTPAAEARLFSAFFSSSDSVTAADLKMTGFHAKLSAVRAAEAERFSGEMSLFSSESLRLKRLMQRLLIIPVVLNSLFMTITSPGALTLFSLVPSLMAYMILSAFLRQYAGTLRSGQFRFSLLIGPLLFLIFLWFFSSSALSILMGREMASAASALFLVSLSVSLFFASSADKRSRYGNEILSEVLGYREFIEKAEKERLEKLSEEDPSFFCHVLPYAMALGLEERWTKAFSGIYVPPASWYRGASPADIYVLSAFPRRWSHLSSSIAPRHHSGSGMRTSRGSSGFSGGGFSGGGGRSW